VRGIVARLSLQLRRASEFGTIDACRPRSRLRSSSRVILCMQIHKAHAPISGANPCASQSIDCIAALV